MQIYWIKYNFRINIYSTKNEVHKPSLIHKEKYVVKKCKYTGSNTIFVL